MEPGQPATSGDPPPAAAAAAAEDALAAEDAATAQPEPAAVEGTSECVCPKIRQRDVWGTGGEIHILNLIYSTLLSVVFHPSMSRGTYSAGILQRSNRGWKDASVPSSRYTYFKLNTSL